MSQKPTFAAVLQNSSFRFLWFNQILIQLAYNTLNFALLIWVFKLTGSNLAVSFLMVAVYLPSLLFGLLAGIYVDLADRRKIILVIDFLIAISFFFFIFIKNSYPLILLNTFFINTLGQFFIPTESSSIPMLVSRRQLLVANSLFSLTLYGSFMIGFAFAGPILNHQGINAVFILGIIAALFALVVALNLPKIQAKQSKGTKKILFSQFHQVLKLVFKEGLLAARFIKGKVNILAAILLMALIQGVIGVLAVIISSYMETVLRIHATDASYVIIIPLGLGMVCGALMIGKFAHSMSKRYLVIPSLILAGTVFLLIGLTPLLADFFPIGELPTYIKHPRFFFRAPLVSILFAVGSFLVGIASIGIIIPAQTVLQENTTEKNRGKIFSVLLVVMNVFAAVVSVLAGITADLLGPDTIFLLMAAVILPIGIVVRSPSRFFNESYLPYRVKEFLGLGHWEK